MVDRKRKKTIQYTLSAIFCSYLVFFTAMQVRQPGHVTRIVSGCEPDEAKAMAMWFDEKVEFMSKRFHLHLTPHFSQVVDETGKIVGDYKFFNKPFGLKHWLENFHLLEFSDGAFSHEDDIVILIDPDMPLMRPITGGESTPCILMVTASEKLLRSNL